MLPGPISSSKHVRNLAGKTPLIPPPSIDNILKRSVSGYNQSIKTWEKQTNPYKSESKRWRALQKDFEKEYGTFDINIQDGIINYPENGETDKKD